MGEGTKMRTAAEIWMLICGLLAAIAIAAVVNLVIPQFDQVFRNFGAELPLLTRLFVAGRYALFGLPVLVLAAWALTPRRTPPGNERGIVALVVGIGLGVILLPLCVIAMYLPIFQLAAVVGG
jgi:type II secretory pathway component PulF